MGLQDQQYMAAAAAGTTQAALLPGKKSCSKLTWDNKM